MKTLRAILLITALFLTSNVVYASATTTESFKLTAVDSVAGACFGHSVAVIGDTAVIGAPSTDYVVASEDLNGVWGSSGSDVFTVGNSGTILHYDGSGWSPMTSPSSEDLNGVWGSSDSDVFAVGNYGAILHYDGDNWTSIVLWLYPLEPFTGHNKGVWGTSGSNVFLVGHPPTTVHTPSAIWHYDGSNWSQMPSLFGPVGADLNGVWGSSGNDVFTVGNSGTILHYDGSNWSPMITVYEQAGAAFVFRWNGTNWVQEAKLFASDMLDTRWFGYSVAIDGDTVVVGAPAYAAAQEAYVFRWNGSTWNEEAKLTAVGTATTVYFGWSVAISGDTIVVGDPEDAAGSAYVFVRNGGTWSLQDTLLASDRGTSDLFGCSVAISGDTATIGAPGDNDNGDLSGSAYVFEGSDGIWSEQTKLTANDGVAWDFFGWSVSVRGDAAVIGAPGKAIDSATDVGAAYVFRSNGSTWSEEARLLASDGGQNKGFGRSVAINEDTALIGAPAKSVTDSSAEAPGSAYVFERSGSNWSERSKLLASDGVDEDAFGWSVAVSGDNAVVGAPAGSVLGDPSFGPGAAYVYDLSINDSPRSDPNGPYTGKAGVPVSFDGSGSYDTDGIIVSYAWDFGDGATDTGVTTTHTYAGAGTYIVSLVVTDNGSATDTAQTTAEITINQPPIADARGPYSVDEGMTLTLDASDSYDPDDAIVFYEWDLDNDGAYDASGVTTTVVFNDDDVYTVGLRVTDSYGGTDTDTTSATVNDLGPVASLNGDTGLDEGQSGSYDASGSTSNPDEIASYEWDWDYDGTTFNPSGDTGVTQVHTWNDNGTYAVAVRVTDEDGSTDIATLSVTVEATPDFPDPTAPVISSVNSSAITVSRATITWTSDEAATSQVEYGQTREYGSSTIEDSNLVTSHSVELTDLKAGKTYHYRVISRDAAGNEAVSTDATFTTSARAGGGMPIWAWVLIGIAAVGVGGGVACLIRTKLAKKSQPQSSELEQGS